ncbi:hypothetical protein HID58_082187 [Brassica napus]|uniref:Uncharacterized protein n=1 Tax=Brassica napus TaxID=3708 RepID=A0ABQ7Y9W1_BRANA|nr:hypothetical protein HID58_082187 [Brassica napus]
MFCVFGLNESNPDKETPTFMETRLRHSRRRKAVATEERRIKAIRDQPCPREENSSDPYVVFNLGKQVSVSLCDCLLTCIYRLFVDLKSYCHNLLIVQKLQTAVVNKLMMSVPKSYGHLHDNLPIDDSIINIVDGKIKLQDVESVEFEMEMEWLPLDQ